MTPSKAFDEAFEKLAVAFAALGNAMPFGAAEAMRDEVSLFEQARRIAAVEPVPFARRIDLD
jgi:hypothetical protein